MRLVFVQTGTRAIPVHDKSGRLVKIIQDLPIVGLEMDDADRTAFPEGRMFRVRATAPGAPADLVELEVLADGKSA